MHTTKNYNFLQFNLTQLTFKNYTQIKLSLFFKLIVKTFHWVFNSQLVTDGLHAQLNQLFPAQQLQVRPCYLVFFETFHVNSQIQALQPQTDFLHAPHHQRFRSGVSTGICKFLLDVSGGGVAQLVGHPEVGVEVGIGRQVADGRDHRVGLHADLRGCVGFVLVARNSWIGRWCGFYFVATRSSFCFLISLSWKYLFITLSYWDQSYLILLVLLLSYM